MFTNVDFFEQAIERNALKINLKSRSYLNKTYSKFYHPYEYTFKVKDHKEFMNEGI